MRQLDSLAAYLSSCLFPTGMSTVTFFTLQLHSCFLLKYSCSCSDSEKFQNIAQSSVKTLKNFEEIHIKNIVYILHHETNYTQWLFCLWSNIIGWSGNVASTIQKCTRCWHLGLWFSLAYSLCNVDKKARKPCLKLALARACHTEPLQTLPWAE